ncbi:AAA-type ATPase lid domain-containing protein [Pedobacter sp. NJ-S-72]
MKTLSRSVFNSLIAYPWPGNVRELEHLMERSVLLSKGNLIKEIHLPKLEELLVENNKLTTTIKTIFDNERDHIFHILQLCKGKISGKGGAAEILGVPATTLNSKIKKFKIKRKHTIS